MHGHTNIMLFLCSWFVVSEWSTSRPGRFNPRKVLRYRLNRSFWGQCGSTKRWRHYTRLYGVINQNIITWIFKGLKFPGTFSVCPPPPPLKEWLSGRNSSWITLHVMSTCVSQLTGSYFSVRACICFEIDHWTCCAGRSTLMHLVSNEVRDSQPISVA